MQPVADPQGAVFFVFHSAQGDEPAATGAGTFHWNELWTGDAKAAVAFYQRVLGYTHEVMPMPEGSYYVLRQGEARRGGIIEAKAGNMPSHWLPYVDVADLDDTLQRVNRNGGSTEMPPASVDNVGRFAVVHDPQGARLGLITPVRR
jgi:predicted enzyme related to lactoylglutathione lyase